MRDKIVPVLKWTIVICWITLIYIVAVAHLPNNPMSPSPRARLLVKSILGEAWGFFTKDPRDFEMYVYSKRNGHWENILLMPNSSYKNFIGLNRRARAQGSEIALLLNGLQKDSSKWLASRDLSHEDFILTHESTAPTLVINMAREITIVGNVWVIFQKPVPWAWSKHFDRIRMPARAIRLQVNI